MSSAPGLHRFVTRTTAPPTPVRFAQRQPRPLGEFCEMCGIDVCSDHSHVVDVDSRRLLCTLPAVRTAVHRGGRRAAGTTGPYPIAI